VIKGGVTQAENSKGDELWGRKGKSDEKAEGRTWRNLKGFDTWWQSKKEPREGKTPVQSPSTIEERKKKKKTQDRDAKGKNAEK